MASNEPRTYLLAIDHFLDGLGDLPHFSQELEGERTPASVEALRRRIAAADALLIATPEYNSAMPGVLKNGLDWASRPSGESVLAAKPAAVLGASPGRFGAVRAQADVRTVLTAIGAEVLALTAMAAFRPRRWRGALLPKTAKVLIEVLDPDKRPVMADADGRSASSVVRVEIRSEPAIRHRILFDPGHGLEERLTREQFV